MDINAAIITALAGVSDQVYWIKWRGEGSPPSQYITFQSRNTSDQFADDEPHERIHYIYLDIFSETDPYTLALSVRSAMAAAGFTEIEMGDVSQETMSVTELRDFHISFTFSYSEVI